MSTVIFSTDNSDIHPWQVFRPSTFHQNDIVLLQRVPFPRDERYYLLPVAEADAAALAVGRVGLLGFPDHCLEYNALHLGPAAHGPRRLGASLDWTVSNDLVHRPVARWGGVDKSNGGWDDSCSYLRPLSPRGGSGSRLEKMQKPPDDINGQHDEGRSSHVW